MPLISSYSFGSATAKTLRRLAGYGHISEYAPNFNESNLDGQTDMTSVLNTACAAARAAAYDAEHRPVVVLPPGTYAISDTVDAHDVSLYAPDGAIIISEALAQDKVAISWDQPTHLQWRKWSRPAASNLCFRGRVSWSNNVLPLEYTPGTYAIGAAAPVLKFENIYVTNYFSVFRKGTFHYMQEWDRLAAAGCEYGIYWPRTDSHSGERIVIRNAMFAKNNEAFWINHSADTNNDGIGDGITGQLSMFFDGCSLDYNWNGHGTLIAAGTYPGDCMNSLFFTNCHLETSHAVSGSSRARIINGGMMSFTNCFFFEMDATYPVQIAHSHNNARTSLIGNHFSMWQNPAERPMCSGGGEWRAAGNIARQGGRVCIVDGIYDEKMA